MKTETIKKLVRCFVILAYIGFILISFEIIYGTYKFIINDLFSVELLYGFVLFYGYLFGGLMLMVFYGYLFGGLMLMVWIIKNRDLLERKAKERQKKRNYAGKMLRKRI